MLARFATVFLVVAGLTRAAEGQALGGYGAGVGPGIGMAGGGGGAMVVPYSGMAEGFMPSRSGGGSLAFRPRPSATFGASIPSTSLAPAAGGMGRRPGASIMPRALGRMKTGPGMGVTPPRIGYPFRQPPSPGGSSSGLGSMPM